MYTLQPEKKPSRWSKILSTLGGLALFTLVYVVLVSPPALTPAASSAATLRDVTYKIRLSESPLTRDGCMEFGVTYRLPTGTAQKDIRACKGYTLVEKFTAQPGASVYLSIQNQSSRTSTVPFQCVIDADGYRIAEVESVGEGHIASCSGSIP